MEISPRRGYCFGNRPHTKKGGSGEEKFRDCIWPLIQQRKILTGSKDGPTCGHALLVPTGDDDAAAVPHAWQKLQLSRILSRDRGR